VWSPKKWVSKGTSAVKESGALSYFINPLVYQDVVGSALMGGADTRGALAAGANPGGYARENPYDLAAFNAALIAGAAGGAMLSPSLAGGTAGLAFTGTGSIGAPLAAGALAGGAAYAGGAAISNANQANRSAPTAPPDVNLANDPNQAQQFQRLRKAAMKLGRAGTIKYKGSSTLGLGETLLGDQMQLTSS
jgi:hypothetical protein